MELDLAIKERAVEAAVQLGSIGQIALTVQNLDRAKLFYRETLGMPFLFEAETMAFFQVGGIRLMIGLAETPVSPAGTILYFRVADIKDVHTTLDARGVVFVAAPHLVASMPDHDLWMAFFNDGEGNTLGLMSELARS